MIKYKVTSYISIILVCITIFGIIKYLDKINLYKINTFEISGNQFIEESEIQNILNKTIKNSSYNINIKEIQNILNKHSYINKSKVYSVLPSKIVVSINEIIPIAIYEDNNEIFFLDKESNKIQANYKSINYYSVPVITNINNQINFKNISNILNTIKNNNQKFYSSINELIIDDDILLMKIQNGTKIYLKKNKEMNNTIKLLSFLNTIKNNKKITDYKYVDLTVPKQIIVKENNKI